MKTLIFNKKFYKNDIKKIINWFVKNYGSIRTNKLVDKLKTLGFNTATTMGISLGIKDLKIPRVKSKLIRKAETNVKNEKIRFLLGRINSLSYLSKSNEIWNQTNNLLTEEITRNYEQKELLNPVYVMIISGARGNLSQIKQLVGMRGLMADAQGEIINTPIKKNLLEGIELPEFFISCYGARKGIIDTALKTANSGYLTRKLIYSAQEEIIKQPNCKTKDYITIKNENSDKKKFINLKKNIIGRILAKDVKIILNKKEINLSQGQDICNYIAKKLFFSKNIPIRSPLTCHLNTGICQMCYGWNLGNGRMVELGETIGILAAQSIGEPGTQLTMRTFHTGGVVNIKTNATTIAPCSGTLCYNVKELGKQILIKSKGRKFITLKSGQITILPYKGNKHTINIPKYSIIYAKNKEKVHRKQIISEKMKWKTPKSSSKKKSITIKSNISGIIEEKNFKNKFKLLEIVIGNIINSKTLKSLMQKEKGKKINLQIKNTKTYIIKKENKYELTNSNKKRILLTIKKTNPQKETTYIIKSKNNQILVNKIKGEIMTNPNPNGKVGKGLKTKYEKSKKGINCSKIMEKRKQGIIIVKSNSYKMENNTEKGFKDTHLIKKDQAIIFLKQEKEKIADIIEGLPKIQQLLEANKNQRINEHLKRKFIKLRKKYKYKIATKKTILLIQKYLLSKIQKVYINQGINISNKHFEVIIKQMTSKVVIKKEGDSKLIQGELINLNKVEKINRNCEEKALYEPIVLGISKLIKLKEGFLCSASFQETTRALSKSAIEGKIDWLNGLKENIILGTLIPGGTGYNK